MLPDLFDPANLAELSGAGDVSTVLMILQSQANLIQNAETLLVEEENLLGLEEPEMSEIAFQQTLAIQKAAVSIYRETKNWETFLFLRLDPFHFLAFLAQRTGFDVSIPSIFLHF